MIGHYRESGTLSVMLRKLIVQNAKNNLFIPIVVQKSAPFITGKRYIMGVEFIIIYITFYHFETLRFGHLPVNPLVLRTRATHTCWPGYPPQKYWVEPLVGVNNFMFWVARPIP
jgi:hypothetical protein